MSRAREAFKNAGVLVTPENLKDVLGAKELNSLAASFRIAMSTTVRDEYSKLASDGERRAWLAQYIIDPQAATLTGFNKTTAFNTSSKDVEVRWWHESQIAKFLCDDEMANVLRKSGELQERSSEFPSLAAKGHKRYAFSRSMARQSTGVTEEAGVNVSS